MDQFFYPAHQVNCVGLTAIAKLRMSSITCGFDATHLYRVAGRAIFKKKDNSYECNSAAGTSPLPEHCSLGYSCFPAVFRNYDYQEEGYFVFTNVFLSLFYPGSGFLILRIALNT